MNSTKYLRKNRNVLISGAGIAGLSLAYWLNEFGFTVTVVEKAASLREGGYRVALRGAAVKVAERMLIMDEVRGSVRDLNDPILIRERPETIPCENRNFFGVEVSSDVDVMHADLTKFIFEKIRKEVVLIFDDSIKNMQETDSGVDVVFHSGVQTEFDFVIGADGLHSTVRRQVFGSDRKFVKNFGSYFALFDLPKFINVQSSQGSPFSEGNTINIFYNEGNPSATALVLFDAPGVDLISQTPYDQKEFLLGHFRNADNIVPEALEHLHHAKRFHLDSVSQVCMDRLSSGRVTLVGDAGYCPSPASGQGASLAIVGAYVLAGELALAGGDSAIAFRRYESTMSNFIRVNQGLAADRLHHFLPPGRSHGSTKSFALRMISWLPFQDILKKKLFRRLRKNISDAANAIVLNDYVVSRIMGYDLPPARLL